MWQTHSPVKGNVHTPPLRLAPQHKAHERPPIGQNTGAPALYVADWSRKRSWTLRCGLTRVVNSGSACHGHKKAEGGGWTTTSCLPRPGRDRVVSPYCLRPLQVLFALFAEFFAPFDRSTCMLTVSCWYTNGSGINPTVRAGFPTSCTRGCDKSNTDSYDSSPLRDNLRVLCILPNILRLHCHNKVLCRLRAPLPASDVDEKRPSDHIP